MNLITNGSIKEFQAYLVSEEKSAATIQKYVRDVLVFMGWLGDRILKKDAVLEYKSYLCEQYAPASVNSSLSSLNSYCAFCGRLDLKVKNLKI